MATRADARRIALSFPGAEASPHGFAFGVLRKGKLKGFAWVWMERVHPKKPRLPNPRVLAVRVANLIEKKRLLAEKPLQLFTEPHYEGYPAVLVRLEAVRAAELKTLLTAAWRTMASPDHLASAGLRKSALPRQRRSIDDS